MPNKKTTTEDALKELKRELKVRLRVFPRWVSSGKLSQSESDKRLEGLRKSIEIVENNFLDESLGTNQMTLGL